MKWDAINCAGQGTYTKTALDKWGYQVLLGQQLYHNLINESILTYITSALLSNF